MYFVPDIWLTPLGALFTALMALVGIEMANNPPTKPRDKWGFRITFCVLAIISIWITLEQSKRSELQKTLADQRFHAEEVKTQTQLGYMTGKLDTLAAVYGDLAKQRPGTGISQLARTLEGIAKQPPPAAAEMPLNVSISQTWIEPRKELGARAVQFILTTNKVMNGAHVLMHCENKINKAAGEIASASVIMGGTETRDEHTAVVSIESPNWSPIMPLVIRVYFDEPDLGKCTFTPL